MARGEPEEPGPERRPGEPARQPVGSEEQPADPDVYLDVPTLKVDEIDLDVEDLHARVALRAELLDMVRLHVGADVDLGKVKLKISGVEAQAVLKVRLDNVRDILGDVLATIDRHPEILDSIARGVGSLAHDAGAGVGDAAGELGHGARRTVEHAGEAVDELGHGAGHTVEQVGEGAGDLGRGAGHTVANVGDEAGGALGNTAREPGRPAERAGTDAEEPSASRPAERAGTNTGERGHGRRHPAERARTDTEEPGHGTGRPAERTGGDTGDTEDEVRDGAGGDAGTGGGVAELARVALKGAGELARAVRDSRRTARGQKRPD